MCVCVCVCVCVCACVRACVRACVCVIERERETDRQTDRQTDRHRQRETERTYEWFIELNDLPKSNVEVGNWILTSCRPERIITGLKQQQQQQQKTHITLKLKNTYSRRAKLLNADVKSFTLHSVLCYMLK